jgi:cytochrome c oxidase subunit 2
MSTPLLIIAAALVGVIFLLLFRVQALIAILRGSDKKPGMSNKVNAFMFLVFLVCFTVGYVYYTVTGDYNLPEAASKHGLQTDELMMVTMVIISIAMLIMNFLLMFFAYKYQYNEKTKAKFFPDHHLLELIWTVVPAIILTYLVVQGEGVWTAVMNPTKEMIADKVELEIVGSQFKWEVRYPGLDGQLGGHKFLSLSAENTFGIDLSDKRGYDDFQVTKIVLPLGRPVHFKIRAKDVLHSVFAPHFRVKMDAVPGMPTEFWFTPSKTTIQMRSELALEPRFQTLDDEGNTKASIFNYEIACAEICGKGHNSMRFVIEVVDQETYDKWYAQQAKSAPFVLLSEDYVKANLPSNMKDVFAEKLGQFKTVESTPVVEDVEVPVSDTVVLVSDSAIVVDEEVIEEHIQEEHAH